MSHNEENKPIVEEIGRFLESKGFTVWIDKWCMAPGDSLIQKIGEALDSSDKLIAFLSPESVESNWVQQELATGKIIELASERGVGEKFIIPVLLKSCKIPWFLKDKLYANFTDKSFEAACQELLRGITGTSGRNDDEHYVNHFIHVTPNCINDIGKYETFFEFGVKITPTETCEIAISINGAGDISWSERLGRNNLSGMFHSLCYENKSIYSGKSNLFKISFAKPRLTSTTSYYVIATTDIPVSEDNIRVFFNPLY
ncbi:toll/interleukin-1 receptor domain-containing protein [Klebsiella pneumoniae]|nr:toll/interleukin-1 receptor domain-containing protein [Klebsiella pneumoniae]ELA0651502.1 toll/interleukin-1 receptor domain-containing protein [Klebsiella pneumoniae]